MTYLRWVEVILKSPASRRQQWVEEIINGFREYRKNYAKSNPVKKKRNFVREAKDDKTVRYLSDVLESGKDYELVGFVPGVEYIKTEGDADDLQCIWEHPHMNPQLLYKHKTLPVFIITGPGLRFNDSVLNEVGLTSDGVRGITG